MRKKYLLLKNFFGKLRLHRKPFSFRISSFVFQVFFFLPFMGVVVFTIHGSGCFLFSISPKQCTLPSRHVISMNFSFILLVRWLFLLFACIWKCIIASFRHFWKDLTPPANKKCKNTGNHFGIFSLFDFGTEYVKPPSHYNPLFMIFLILPFFLLLTNTSSWGLLFAQHFLSCTLRKGNINININTKA